MSHRARWTAVVCAAALVAATMGLARTAAAAGGHVNRIGIDGSINPASADFIIGAIEQSERDGAKALLLELDTPGGLVSSTQDIIQSILNASVPVIVYVTPRGAWAARRIVMVEAMT